MSIPSCDPADTITQVDLDKARAQQGVLKIKYFYTEEGSYLMFELAKDPGKDYYLATRRERNRPKLFVDQNLLLADLNEKFPGLVFEANGRPVPTPSDDGSWDESSQLHLGGQLG